MKLKIYESSNGKSPSYLLIRQFMNTVNNTNNSEIYSNQSISDAEFYAGVYPLDKRITFVYAYVREEPKHSTGYARVYNNLGSCATVHDFWKVVNALNLAYKSPFLSISLPDKEKNADSIFFNLLNGNFKKNSYGNMINEFNYLHPTWTLMNVDESEPPYIRDDKGLVKNEINLYAKESRTLNDKGLFLTNTDFTGFMDVLVIDFVRGKFPDNVIAMVFQKTIESVKPDKSDPSKVFFYRGFRIRILLDDVCNFKTTEQLKNFILTNYHAFRPMFKI